MKISNFVINRPEVANAFDVKTALKLKEALKLAIKINSSGFIISAGSSQTFCSGGDLKSYSSVKSKNQGVENNKIIRKVLQSFKHEPLLIVAAIEGDALGGGCELALSCDFIVCSQRARFSFRQVRQNLTPGWGGLAPLLNRVSKPVALDWLATGRWISSTEAYDRGLVDQVTLNENTIIKSEELITSHHSNILPIIKSLLAKEGLGEEKEFARLWWSTEHRAAIKRTLKN